MFVNVAKLNKLTRGTAKLIHVKDLWIAVFNAEGALYALEDSCPFDGASLSDGWVMGSVVECRGDRARFFLPTGECLWQSEGKNIRSFRVVANEEHLFVGYDKDRRLKRAHTRLRRAVARRSEGRSLPIKT
jgi:3-phenylpropionate/trans-cinnamate dioxygenase ferredoxin component